MDINNFENIRAGVFPVSVDVLRISNHNTGGVIAKVYLHKENNESYVQVRKHNRDNFVFIATYRYRDITLSDYYLDSSILFDSRVWSHSLTTASDIVVRRSGSRFASNKIGRDAEGSRWALAIQ